MIVSCVFLALNFYFLIGGLMNNRLEDILIAAVVGFILYLAITFVKGNAFELPKISFAMLILWPIVSLIGIIAMVNALNYADGSVGQFFTYSSEMWEIFTTENRDIPRSLQELFFLSGGIITGIIFLITHIAAFFLLFFKTMPVKKSFRH
jgi:lysylphosphatidylglycerol synthetase-like protein (DUF2156 family)